MTKLSRPILRGVARYVWDNEILVRTALKGIHATNRFSYSGNQERQLANIQAVRGRRPTVPTTSFHLDWASVDDRRASAACTYEQFRARVWACGLLPASLSPDFRNLVHLTFASTKDQRPSGSLLKFKLNNFKRRIRGALIKLQEAFPRLWAVGIIEISATEVEQERHMFEPHLHLLVNGVPTETVREAFQSLIRSSTRGSHPIMLKPVLDDGNLRRGLSYFLKFSPELRTKFLTSTGRVGKGRLNHMRGELKAEWLSFMAAHRVDQLLISIGLAPKIMEDFKAAQLQWLIEKLPQRH